MAIKAGYGAKTHKMAVEKFIETGHLVPMTKDMPEIRKEIGISRIPPTIQCDKNALSEFQAFLETLKLGKLAAKLEMVK
jgi:heterodisulfide reductase subunit C